MKKLWSNSAWNRGLLGALLVLLTLAVFWPVIRNSFINYDDGEYVFENPHVRTGLTWENFCWAFQAGYADNWHPLTWLSHMLDVQLFGLRAGWHHLMNLAFHVANALLLFLLFCSLTKTLWRSFVVAGLFALHPLHVESVAWVSERKDVLSTFFFLLTLWAYARYAAEARSGVLASSRAGRREGEFSAGRMFRSPPYIAALVFYLLGLMSKPMVVTLPFVLLLLDFWPLARFGFPAGSSNPTASQAASSPGEQQKTPRPALALKSFIRAFWPVLWEKVPFLLLVPASCWLTLVAQRGAMVDHFPLAIRAANAVASCLKYLAKTIWPSNLTIFYPHPDIRYFASRSQALLPASEQWPTWQIVAAALLLASVSILVFLRRRRQGWLTTGWFWYLGTLAPVIGIIQVGTQGMADRYTYVPLIGVFVCVVWGAAALGEGRRFGRALLVAGSAFLLGACLAGTRKQLAFWRNDTTLFEHALKVTSPSALAHRKAGLALLIQGKLGLAQTHFRAALVADPYYPEAHSGLGMLFELEGRTNLAVREYQAALAMRPGDGFARISLARLRQNLNQPTEALADYREALRYNPDNVQAHYLLGELLLEQDDLSGAAQHLARAVQLNPGHTDALLSLSEVRLKQGRAAEAEAFFREVVRLYPTNAELRVNLGGLLWQQGKLDAARAEYTEALRLSPALPMAHYDLATVLRAQGRLAEATSEFAQAAHLKPDYVEALIEYGRLLAQQGKLEAARPPLEQALHLNPTNASLCATLGAAFLLAGHTNESAVAFSTAVRLEPDLAQRALEQGRALAARGQLKAAVQAVEKARNLAAAAGDQALVRAAEAALFRYQKDPPPPTPAR